MDNAQTSDDQSTPAKVKNSKVKRIAAIVAVPALIGIATYAVGRWQGYSQFLPQRAELEQQVEAAQAEVDAAQTRLEQTQQQLLIAQNYGYLMEARAALYHTAVDLERRNFGIANTHLKEAANALDRVQAVNDRLNIEKLSSLQESIAQTGLNVAVNLQQQRNLILNFVTQLDELIPESSTETPTS